MTLALKRISPLALQALVFALVSARDRKSVV